MKVREMFHLQDQVVPHNIKAFGQEFSWCHDMLELGIESHVFLGDNPQIIAHRKHLSESDTREFEAMNVIVNLAYDAVGSIISALRLLEFGVITDTWSLLRGAFESSCYAEFFRLRKNKVKDYLSIAEEIKHDRSVNLADKLRENNITINRVMGYLEQWDSEARKPYYARLCNLGTHASPIRCGMRIRRDEAERVRAYLSISHRELRQCLHDLAATTKYAVGIPFEAWPDLMAINPQMLDRYKSLEEEYKATFPGDL